MAFVVMCSLINTHTMSAYVLTFSLDHLSKIRNDNNLLNFMLNMLTFSASFIKKLACITFPLICSQF